MNKIIFSIFSKYISFPIISDSILILICLTIYYYTPYKYFEIPEFITIIIGLPGMFIFSKSEKIKKFKDHKLFKKITIIFIVYLIIFGLLSYILKTFSNIFGYIIFNLFISILTIIFLRLLIFSFFVFILWIRSKNK